MENSFWPSLYKQAVNLAEPPDTAIATLLSQLQAGMTSEAAAKYLDRSLAKKN